MRKPKFRFRDFRLMKLARIFRQMPRPPTARPYVIHSCCRHSARTIAIALWLWPAAPAFALSADQDRAGTGLQQLAQAPVPPRRPARLDQRDAPAGTQSEPAQTPSPASARAVTIKPALAPAAKPEEPLYHPMTEPGAMGPRRATLRACTEEWQKLKKSGAAANRIWRDFSMECLTRKN